ncbi:MAG: DUF2807 domain-containing protein [Betaproteobacteria bacterium]|nr:DUF2807 domain-containing protein [Betaproteobacteria bacterium]
MNTFTRLSGSRPLVAAFAAAMFCGAFAATAGAGEGSDAKSGHFSFNWSFGNNVNYGGNQTKGSGVVKQESRAVANFSRLVLALPATVTLSQGPAESLTISADDNLLPLMTTRVAGDELIIEGDNSHGFSTRNAIKVRLTVKTLNAITIKGSGDVFGDQFKSDKLDISIAGSGDVKLKSIRADQVKIGIEGSGDISVDAIDSKLVDASIQGSGDIRLPSLQSSWVKISVNGSGDISAAGNTDKVDVEIMGSGDVRTGKLVAREAGVKIMASGDAVVHAKEKLIARVYGSGDVRYAGSPANVSRTVEGSGSIKAL